MNKSATIYIDGASQGNPGPAGIGIVIYPVRKKGSNGVYGNDQPVENIYKYIGEATNNVAEYTALIYSLQEALILGIKDVVINSDSELLVNQLKGIYKVRDLNLRSLYEQFVHLKSGFKNLEVRLIRRKENQEADKLANRAVDSRLDTGLKRASQKCRP